MTQGTAAAAVQPQPQAVPRPRGEAAFFEPEPHASLYDSLPVSTGLARPAQSSRGRYGGDPYASMADDSRRSSYHLFANQSSPRNASLAQRRGARDHLNPLGMGMASLSRQSTGESKSSASLLGGDRYDAYSSPFGAAAGGASAHDTSGFGANDYSQAPGGASNAPVGGGGGNTPLSLNFPPGLGGGAGPRSSRAASRGPTGFSDDLLGGSAWRTQPHEQKLPPNVGGGGPRPSSGAARGAIGGPAPPVSARGQGLNSGMDRVGSSGGLYSSNPRASPAAADFGGPGAFSSLYPTSKRPRSRYDFFGQQGGAS